MRRVFAWSIALPVLIALSGCLDAAAPTPVSSIVEVWPRSEATNVGSITNGTTFLMRLNVVNRGDRAIHFHGHYEIEKLVNQKWQLAYATPDRGFQGSQTIQPSRSIDALVSARYVRGETGASSLLANMRGLYRARLRLSYSQVGDVPLPADAGYSIPFAVLD